MSKFSSFSLQNIHILSVQRLLISKAEIIHSCIREIFLHVKCCKGKNDSAKLLMLEQGTFYL